MALDFGLLKEHPYATGGVIIVGGIVVFYLLSSSQSSGGTSSNSSGNFQAAVQADAQLAAVQAGASTQNAATQAQIQEAQIAADSANAQTQASLDANNINTAAQLAGTLATIAGNVQENTTTVNATTAQLANQDIFNENVVAMQDAVLESQINSGVYENANNNATALAAQENANSVTESLGTQSISAATTLAEDQQQNFETNVQSIIPLAGQQKNSALDATDQTSLFGTILANGNPSVAAAGTVASSTAAVSGNSASVAKTGILSSGINSLLQGLFG